MNPDFTMYSAQFKVTRIIKKSYAETLENIQVGDIIQLSSNPHRNPNFINSGVKKFTVHNITRAESGEKSFNMLKLLTNTFEFEELKLD